MSCTLTGSSATLFENGMYIGMNMQDILYGIELVLYFRTMRIFLARRMQRHRSDIFYGALSTMMFVLITIWITALDRFGQKMWLLDRNFPGGPMGYYAANTPVLYMDFGRVALTILQQLTDGLMIYRCRIVWGRLRVVFVPSVLWLVNLGLGSLLDWTASTPGITFFSGIAAKLGLAYYSISAFLNVTLSCMICYRLICHARTVKEYLGHKHAIPYRTMVALVVESALPLTLSSIAFLVSYGMSSQTAAVFSFIHPLMMCISPQMLILRVVKGEAWKKPEEEFPGSIIRVPSGHGDTSSPGHFDGSGTPNLHREQSGHENDRV